MSNSVSHDTTNNKGISMSTGKIPMSEDEQTSFADTTVTHLIMLLNCIINLI